MGMKLISDAIECPQPPNPQPNKFTILKKRMWMEIAILAAGG